ncbi:MAG: lysophospholipid acyltransferase family protein [Myxococcota bacterium]
MVDEAAPVLVASSQSRGPELRDAIWNGPLSLVERASLAAALTCNESAPLKWLSNWWANAVVGHVVSSLCDARLRVSGVEHIERLAPSGGVLLAANHRTFFDLFAVAYAFRNHTRLCRGVYFPVRSHFWYDHPLGPWVNVLGTGMNMFPPVFRASHKREVTRRGLDWLAQRLGQPGVVVGMHPEGTRSRGADPFALLPPEQSFGRVALLSRATIVPAFVHGLSDSIWNEVRRRKQRDAVVDIAFGAPVNSGEFDDCDPRRLRNQLGIGERVLQSIHALALDVHARR